MVQRDQTISNTTVSVSKIVSESARRFPQKTAFISGENSITYAQLWERVAHCAGALSQLGIKRNSVVAILIPNTLEFPVVYYATLALGAVVLPVHALFKAPEIEFVLRDSQAELLVSHQALLEHGLEGAALAGVPVAVVGSGTSTAEQRAVQANLDELAAVSEAVTGPVLVEPQTPATILYTSGTTGTPKGAMTSHLALIEQTNILLLNTFEIHSSDVIFGSLPLFHTFGQTCVLNTGLRAGATIVLTARFEQDKALALMNEHRATIIFAVPTMYIALLQAGEKNPERPPLRYGVSGGSSLPVAIINRFQESFNAPIHEGYGLTETAPVAAFNHIGKPPRPGSIGTPIWGVEVEIANQHVRDAIELLPRGEVGELVIRGHNLMLGYLGRPEADREAVVDGWFRTGDLGVKDSEDYLRILDRTKDVIIRNGYTVYPREIEEVLSRHPSVQAVAVFGVPDAFHGQEIAAAVVPAANSVTTENDLANYAQDNLAHHKYPRIIEFSDALPLGPSGKVLKHRLQENYQDNHGR